MPSVLNVLVDLVVAAALSLDHHDVREALVVLPTYWVMVASCRGSDIPMTAALGRNHGDVRVSPSSCQGIGHGASVSGVVPMVGVRSRWAWPLIIMAFSLSLTPDVRVPEGAASCDNRAAATVCRAFWMSWWTASLSRPWAGISTMSGDGLVTGFPTFCMGMSLCVSSNRCLVYETRHKVAYSAALSGTLATRAASLTFWLTGFQPSCP